MRGVPCSPSIARRGRHAFQGNGHARAEEVDAPTDLFRAFVKLPRHLDHGSTEAKPAEEALGGVVPLRRREYDPGRASSLKCRECGVEKHSADAAPALRRINDDVIQHARRPSQRHVVAPLDTRIRVPEHSPAPLGNEHDNARLFELRPEKRRVATLGLWCGRDEALRIEIVVRSHEQRTESADGFEVRGRGGSDRDAGRVVVQGVVALVGQRSILACAAAE